MARAIAIARLIETQSLEGLRIALVAACGAALIVAGRPLPF